MKHFIFITFFFFFTGHALADCVLLGTIYVSCKPGYYLSSDDCIRCPSSDGIYGTTEDYNTGDITSCYIQSGTGGIDDTGSWVYTENCYYTN